MNEHDDAVICVQAMWSGWEGARVRLGDVQGLHWFQPPGAPRPIAHGYVRCADFVGGRLPGGGEAADRQGRRLVCILKRQTPAAVYAEIARRASACGTARSPLESAAAPAGAAAV
ncbi:MAG: hypothetical protein A3H96_07495 [Acidobacteria bacterium RIFCSPLOWO2_02_FULL_67_36]|nr:MAG: hypothetical protein A3H96_07495 [Acidobacteria bacterium RIFCSPLOWO2_02_FULL_67_36]OFW23645.1 MAG: hypothetical protein A3G21_06925 [Acidobacteria bacterium RIFCSPLOWO2_12_FULL_66_21]